MARGSAPVAYAREALTALLLVAAAALAGAGCGAPTFLHEDYARLAPSTVAVLPSLNRTIYQLDEVTFGGLLQRAMSTPRPINVPLVVQGAVQDALVARGYGTLLCEAGSREAAVDFTRPLVDAEPRRFDAACITTIEGWRSDRTSTSTLYMKYRVDLYRVPTAELLFTGHFSVTHGPEHDIDDSADSTLDVPRILRDAVMESLSALPRPRGE
jgi:hypothetical protein